MSTIGKMTIKCSMCKRSHVYKALNSTNAFGESMYLDTRPSHMNRDSMNLLVQECPFCGYVAKEVSDETIVTKEYLQTQEYLSCGGIDFKSNIAKKFYKYYLLKLKENDSDKALWASLRAIWSSDDAGDRKAANICRGQSIRLISQIDKDGKSEDLLTMKADLFRRIGNFKDVINQYEGLKLDNDLLQILIDFEVDRAKKRDTKSYTVTEVVRGKYNKLNAIGNIDNEAEKKMNIVVRFFHLLLHNES